MENSAFSLFSQAVMKAKQNIPENNQSTEMCGVVITTLFLLNKKKSWRTFYSLTQIRGTASILVGFFWFWSDNEMKKERCNCVLGAMIGVSKDIHKGKWLLQPQALAECSFSQCILLKACCQVAYAKINNFDIVTAFCGTVLLFLGMQQCISGCENLFFCITFIS